MKNNNQNEQKLAKIIDGFNDYFFQVAEYYMIKWNLKHLQQHKNELKQILTIPNNKTKLIDVFSIITNDHSEEIKNKNKEYIFNVDFQKEIKKIDCNQNVDCILQNVADFLDIVKSVDSDDVDSFVESLCDLVKISEKYINVSKLCKKTN